MRPPRARLGFGLALLLAGCGGEEPSAPRGPAVQVLTLDGFRLEAPARFHDLEPERVAGLEAAPARTDPSATSRVRAVRGERMSEGTVLLIRVDHPQAVLVGENVEEALRHAIELDTATARRPGATIQSHEITRHEGWLESALHVLLSDGETSITMRSRSIYWLTDEGDLTVVGVQCMAPPGVSRRMCPDVLESLTPPETIESSALDAPR